MSTLDANLKKHTPDATLCVNLWCCLNQMLLAHGNWRIAIASKNQSWIVQNPEKTMTRIQIQNCLLWNRKYTHTLFTSTLQLENITAAMTPWNPNSMLPVAIWNYLEGRFLAKPPNQIYQIGASQELPTAGSLCSFRPTNVFARAGIASPKLSHSRSFVLPPLQQ